MKPNPVKNEESTNGLRSFGEIALFLLLPVGLAFVIAMIPPTWTVYLFASLVGIGFVCALWKKN